MADRRSERDPAAPPVERPARPTRGFWPRVAPPSCWVLLALSAGAAPYWMWLLAADPEGGRGLLGWLLICPGAQVTAWACLATLWRPDPNLGTLNLAALRAVVVPLVTAPLLGVVNLVTRYVPPVSERVEEHTHGDWYHPHYWFEQADVPAPLMVVGGGIVFSMLAGLVVTAFLVWPISALWTPDRMIRDSGLDPSADKRAANVFTVRGYAVILPLTFVFALLVTAAGEDGLPWWPAGLVGVALAAVVYAVRRRQRLARAGRAD